MKCPRATINAQPSLSRLTAKIVAKPPPPFLLGNPIECAERAIKTEQIKSDPNRFRAHNMKRFVKAVFLAAFAVNAFSANANERYVD